MAVGCARRGEVEQRTYDAGAYFADEAGKISHTFKILNRKDYVINVNEITRSCSCTGVALDSRRLAPGGSAELKMTVNPNRALGRWQVLCTLATDDPGEPNRTYLLAYRTYPRARFDAGGLNLGVVSGDGPGAEAGGPRHTTWFEIYEPAGGRPDTIDGFEAPPPLALEHDRVPVIDSLEGGAIRRSRYRLGVRHAPGATGGGTSGVHSATITGRSALGRVATVTATWSVSLPVEVSPNPVSFGLVGAADGPVRKTIAVRSADGTSFRLLTIDGGAGVSVGRAGKAEGGVTPASSHVVDLVLTDAPPGKRFLSGKVRISTDHPKVPHFDVAWSAIVKR